MLRYRVKYRKLTYSPLTPAVISDPGSKPPCKRIEVNSIYYSLQAHLCVSLLAG